MSLAAFSFLGFKKGTKTQILQLDLFAYYLLLSSLQQETFEIPPVIQTDAAN